MQGYSVLNADLDAVLLRDPLDPQACLASYPTGALPRGLTARVQNQLCQ